MRPPNRIDERAITEYVDSHIDEFHRRRSECLKGSDLRQLLRRTKPYMLRSKRIVTPREIIIAALDAHISSREEAMFGDFIEGLAIEAARLAFGGWKSEIAGIDLELEKGDVRYIVSIEPGPSWGDSSQVAKMRADFRKAAQGIQHRMNVIAVSGCCYGMTTARYDKGDYLKLAGQDFWEFLTGEDDFYVRVVEPLALSVWDRDHTFAKNQAVVLRQFENEFVEDFCDPSTGWIDWNKLVRFNSKSAASST